MDPRELERQKRGESRRRHRLRQDWKHLLAQPQGRRVIQDLMERWGIHRRTPMGSMADTNESIGRRNCALDLRDEVIAHRPEVLAGMEAELAAVPDFGEGEDDDGE